MVENTVAKLKALVGTIRANIVEIYTALLIVLGLPFVAYIFTNLKAAFTVFVLVNIALGLFTLRATE